MSLGTPQPSPILLTGATGYVGGRLLQSLERGGHRVRCLARRPKFLTPKVAPTTEVVAGDVLDRGSLDIALRGVSVAYYLVHSMGSTGSFEEEDRRAARNFGEAAKAARVQRIIYLGGLGHDNAGLSPHLRSRQEVGEILRQSGVPVVEFRASIVIGSGSLSFELIRALVERLPVMITPRWVSVPAQPIAIEDLIAYLTAAMELPIAGNHVFEVGGADQVSYADIMRAYARCRGIRIRMISVPVLTPYLSSLWLGLVTPVYARVGRKLIDSIRHETVVWDRSALKTFNIRPMGIDEALRRALANEDNEFAATRWSDALSSAGQLRSWGGVRFGTRLVDSRTAKVQRPPAVAFKAIQRIGGDTGWYAWNWLWRLRGFLDLLVGGVGMRRGRPDAESLRVGDTIDFWRVEALEPDRRLRLVAEMKLPGRAWLEFEVTGSNSSSTIRQTAVFDPAGLLGQAYWYALYPMHQLVFAGTLRGLVDAAFHEREAVPA
ncbi:MAG TPA: SDR family oxidoreductase [Candidatus Methylomirabilis sp.]|nr:SDR family oxidoreductase [Candidatus Methylomirabilis sp.]